MDGISLNNRTDNLSEVIDTDALKIIKGRLEPHIYAFRIESFPPSYKIGDTFREVALRVDEWRKIYDGLSLLHKSEWEWSSMLEDRFFRDYSVHKYLEDMKGKKAMAQHQFGSHHVSSEFYLDTEIPDIEEAISYIKKNASLPTSPYKLYSTATLKDVDKGFERNMEFKLRDNQLEVVDNFEKAYKQGQRKMLMYAVMRFGKTFTALSCAKRIGARSVIVVSAKADVADEWRKNVQSIKELVNFEFFSKNNISGLDVNKKLSEGKTVVIFLTLQDLQGIKIKPKHKKIFDNKREWDMVIVDESHFGARAPQYGIPLTDAEKADADEDKSGKYDDHEKLEKGLKQLKRKVTLHLSGTPYRILMSNEFNKDNLIACVRYPDIIRARDEWFKSHVDVEGTVGKVEEWDNPYFGFPQMVRFAFNLNEESLRVIKNFEAEGASVKFSELFKPIRTGKDSKTYKHRKFVHENEVLSFLKVIDGTKDDVNVLSFLDNERIKQGKLCNHIVMVLPFRASCDAMSSLIEEHKDKFKNLCDYKIINIAGHDSNDKILTLSGKIEDCESKGEKTLSLTVRRMLTGVTVPEWDTMIYLKESFSPEEYDQAIFRLQNKYVRVYKNGDSIVKYDMKPQTILVDFDPQRMFRLQEQKCRIYNSVPHLCGSQDIKEAIEEELKSSPIISLDHHKLRQMDAADLMDDIRKYAQTRGIPEEAATIPVDGKLLENKDILDAISRLNGIDNKGGICKKANAINGDGDDVKSSKGESGGAGDDISKGDNKSKKDKSDNLAKKLASYYSLILYFAFLTPDRITSIGEMISVLNRGENKRIARHLGIERHILKILSKSQPWSLFELNKSINDTNYTGVRSDISHKEMVDVIFKRCRRLSESEIITPQETADKMVALLPDDVFEGDGVVLDIASKQGEFAAALKRRYGDRYPEECRTRIYSICTSGLAYEFTRKTYKYLGMDINNIVRDKTSYHIIAGKLADSKKGKYPTVKEIIGKDVKINAIIGNPPYQVTSEKTSDAPLYHLFMDASYKLTKVAAIITPSRYIFNAGKTPVAWNKKMLSDSHLKIADYSANSTDFFPNVDIKGGVAISLRNLSLTYGPIITYTAYPQLNSIISKVSAKRSQSICDIIYPQNKFNLDALSESYKGILSKIGSDGREKRLTTSIFNLIEVFKTESDSNDDVVIFGLVNNKRCCRWIDKSLLAVHPNIYKWKVILPKSNGTGTIGEVLSSPFIGKQGVGITQSFITFGAFDSKKEAEACLKYIKSKFARVLLGALKVTQDNSKETWANVPLQNFSDCEDIDWSRGIAEIDAQLYEKYGLSAEEIEFIESMVKPME